MMFGRPLMLTAASTYEIALPGIIDDEQLTTYPNPPGEQPSDKPSYMAFWRHAVELIQVAGDILEAIYTRGSGKAVSDKHGCQGLGHNNFESRLARKIKAGDFHEILQLDAALTRWRDSVPEFLGFGNEDSTSYEVDMPRVSESLRRTFRRQARVLHVRYGD